MFVTSKKVGAALIAASLTAALAACGPQAPGPASDQLQVLAAFYPLAFVAEQVGGDRVAVTTLTPAGAEPHDLELAPAHTRQIGQADLVLFQSGFQPAVEKAVEARNPEHVLDSAHLATLALALDPEHSHDEDSHNEDDHDHDHGPNDPHFWLDPELLTTFATEVADELTALDPQGTAHFATNLAALTKQLDQLDQDYSAALATCQNRAIVVTHSAFGYPARKYDFDQIAIVGVDPEAEPSPAQLKKVSALVVERGIDTIFFETLVSPKVAQTLASDLNIASMVLDPIEGLTQEEDTYFTIMESNLAALSAGMQCS